MKLQNMNREYVLSKQLLRSGTAVGALLREAEFGQSRADYIHKFSISLKEANETRYWLELLNGSELLSKKEFSILHNECSELVSMLASSIYTLKKR